MKNKKRWLLILDGVIAALIALLPLITKTMMESINIPCKWEQAVGVPCPSCGGTRCVRYFFTGHFIDAFLVHPIVFLIIIHLLVLLVAVNIQTFAGKGRPLVRFLSDYRMIIFWVITYAVFGLIRGFVLA